MNDKAQRAKDLEKSHIELKSKYDELMEINETLCMEMEEKDRHLLDAVSMVERYQKQLGDLERTLQEVNRFYEECKEHFRPHQVPSITLSEDDSTGAYPHKTMYADSNKSGGMANTRWESSSPCPSERQELSIANLLLLNSPRLSILSEAEFTSVYGRRDDTENEFISEFDDRLTDSESFRLPARALFGFTPDEPVEHQYDSYVNGKSPSRGLRPSPRLEMQKADGASSSPRSLTSTTNTGSETESQSWTSSSDSKRQVVRECVGHKTISRPSDAVFQSRIPVRISRPTTASDGTISSPTDHTPLYNRTGTPPGTAMSQFGTSPPKWTSILQDLRSKSAKVDAGTSPMSTFSQRKKSLDCANTPRPSTGKSELFTDMPKTPRLPPTTNSSQGLPFSSQGLPLSRIKVQPNLPPQEPGRELKGRSALTRMGQAALNATRRTSDSLRSRVESKPKEAVMKKRMSWRS